jgi:membrane protease YdiL (CAAX protease family)
MSKKTAFVISLLVYFATALAIMFTAWFFPGESLFPIVLSLVLLLPLYFWKVSYTTKVELSKKVDGRPMRDVYVWVLVLFILAFAVRIPSVLLFNMPYEKAPLIYLLTLTMILVEGTDPLAFGFKAQGITKAFFYGAAFFAVLQGTGLFIQCLAVYSVAGQMLIYSFDAKMFLLSVPYQILLVGVSEEGLFRGYIQTHLERSHVGKAILVQAVLFGFWHFVWDLSPFNPFGMVQYITSTFFFGLLFGYFYSKAKNLVPLILTHGLWNSFQSGIITSGAVLDLLSQASLLNQILVWLLPYALAAAASVLFIKYGVKET